MTIATANKARWGTESLDRLIPDVKTGFPSGERLPHGVVQVRMNNVDLDGTLDLTTATRVPADESMIETYRLERGDVLFNNTNSTELVGKTAVFPGADEPVLFSNHFSRLRVDHERLDPWYLGRWLSYQQRRRVFRGLCNRWVNQSAVRREALLGLEIPIPFPDDPRRSLAEQKRIAAILDRADAIRRRRQEAARLADTLIPSVFYEMFGDPVTNAKKWPTESLDQVAQLDRGRSRHRPRDWAPLYGGPYPLIQTGDIANCNGVIRKYTQTYSEEGLAQSKLWPKGTLCITIAANIGKTGILAFDACFPDSVVGLVAGPRLTIEYVREWFVAIQKNLDDSAPQVAQKNINLAILNALQIPVPPKPLQEQFSQIVESVRASQERASGVDAQAGTLFDSLVQRAFRGEL